MEEKYTLTVIRERNIENNDFYHLNICAKLMEDYIKIEQERRKFGLKNIRFMYITDKDGKILAEWISK